MKGKNLKALTPAGAVLTVGLIVAQTVMLSAETAQPSFDCKKANSDAEQLICEDASLAELDLRLAERFKAAQTVIGEMDAGGETAMNDLRATQRGWIKGRDECWKADDLLSCVEFAYLTREVELVSQWLLEEPKSVVAYACDENPANEVTVYFFETELPGIRLEYGDSIRSGWSVPAASGAKYATEFGGEFWSKGDEAQFTWTEGQEMGCIRTN